MRRNSRLWPVLVVLAFLVINGIYGGKTASARSFPEWKEEPVQVISENPIFASDKIAELNRKLSAYPHPVKVLIFESLGEKAGPYARAAFGHYKLPDDQLLVVFDLESEEMEAVAGSRLSEEGLTPEELADKKSLYFDNFKKTGNYLEGLDVFLEQVFSGLGGTKAAQAEKEPAFSPESAAGSTDGRDAQAFGKAGRTPGWLLPVLFLLAFLLAAGLFFWWKRRRLMLKLSYLEEWKEELEQGLETEGFPPPLHPLEEGERIRRENLQRIYEDWLTRGLPSLEEEMAEAEHLLRRFRLFSAQVALRFIEQTLAEMEAVLAQFKLEVRQAPARPFVAADGLEKADQAIARIRKKLLALRSQYGVGFQRISQFLKEAETELLPWRNAADGNKETDAFALQELLDKLEELEAHLERADQWAAKMEEEIPSRLKDLESRVRRAKDAGKEERWTEVVQIIKECREKWNSLVPLWDEGNLPALSSRLDEIEERLGAGEAMLEAEETFLKELEELAAECEKRLRACAAVYLEDREKVKRLIHRYQLEDDPVFDLQQYVERELKELDRSYGEMAEQMETGERRAGEKARELLQRISSLEGRISDYHQRVLLLSGGEEQYVREVRSLRNRLRLLRQKLDRFRHLGNVDHLRDLIEQSWNAVLVTEVLLDQIPLHLNKIAHHLQQAREQVEQTERMIDRTIESAQEAEAIICRLNIYRNRLPQIGQLLMMAENHYWDNRFEEALDIARKAEQLLMKKRA